MSTHFRKTAKGQAEIETRAHRLTPRQRSVLILVDGKRSDGELRALVGPPADELLSGLQEGGFIEARAAATPRVGATGIMAAPADAPAAAAPQNSADFQRSRQQAVQWLTQLVGPEAESLAIRMERARSAEELRPLLQLAVQSVANMRGRQAAEDFARRLSTL